MQMRKAQRDNKNPKTPPSSEGQGHTAWLGVCGHQYPAAWTADLLSAASSYQDPWSPLLLSWRCCWQAW